MNNFLKYPQGGGGENIDVTPLINKDNLVSITGYIYGVGQPVPLIKQSELNSSNNFSNIEEVPDKMPTLLEIKFKNISFVIDIQGASPIHVIDIQNTSPIRIGFNKILNMSEFGNNGNSYILIFIDDIIDGESVQTTLGTYYHDEGTGDIS